MRKVFSGSIVGPHHEKKGEVSQDFYAEEIIESPHGDMQVIVATDGAGSLEKSLEGARFVALNVATALKEIAVSGEEVTELAMENIFLSVREMLMEIEDYRLMGCTLSAAILSDDYWCIGVLGDAFAIVHRVDGGHDFVQPVSDSEYANVTELITSKNVKPVFRSGVNPIRGISVASDGLQRMSVKGSEAVPGFWDALLNHMNGDNFSMAEFLDFLKSKERLDDDTTLVTCVEMGGENQ